MIFRIGLGQRRNGDSLNGGAMGRFFRFWRFRFYRHCTILLRLIFAFFIRCARIIRLVVSDRANFPGEILLRRFFLMGGLHMGEFQSFFLWKFIFRATDNLFCLWRQTARNMNPTLYCPAGQM